ncbi:hypothetical protein Tsp_09628 [Trichinella spiralis]|uniref:hypothetical protein n=1 Tax=Trichinella spiralis TaxID=6334 RepID=UPI0001EFF040|nr:hypothetical protein Tsp_09628 [Trichinella spiralis]
MKYQVKVFCFIHAYVKLLYAEANYLYILMACVACTIDVAYFVQHLLCRDTEANICKYYDEKYEKSHYEIKYKFASLININVRHYLLYDSINSVAQ